MADTTMSLSVLNCSSSKHKQTHKHDCQSQERARERASRPFCADSKTARQVEIYVDQLDDSLTSFVLKHREELPKLCLISQEDLLDRRRLVRIGGEDLEHVEGLKSDRL